MSQISDIVDRPCIILIGGSDRPLGSFGRVAILGAVPSPSLILGSWWTAGRLLFRLCPSGSDPSVRGGGGIWRCLEIPWYTPSAPCGRGVGR